MTISTKHSGKARSIPLGLTMAATISLGITVVSAAAIAYFLNAEKLTWTQAGYWIMGMLFAASFIGGKIAYAAVKRQRLIISMLSGLIYWGLLLCTTALFFGGNYEAVGETAGIILAGTCSANLLTLKKTNHFRKKYKS